MRLLLSLFFTWILSVAGLCHETSWLPLPLPVEDGTAAQEMLARIERLQLPSVEFEDVMITKALESLRAETTRVTAGAVVIQISPQLMEPREFPEEPKLNFAAQNVSLADVLRRIKAEDFLIEIRVKAGGVFVHYNATDGGSLLNHAFRLPAQIFGTSGRPQDYGVDPVGVAEMHMNLVRYFEEEMHTFPEGGYCRFERDEATMIVRDTVDGIRSIYSHLTELIPPAVPGPEVFKGHEDKFLDGGFNEANAGLILKDLRIVDCPLSEAVKKLGELSRASALANSKPDSIRSDPPGLSIPGLEPIPGAPNSAEVGQPGDSYICLAEEEGKTAQKFAQKKVSLKVKEMTLLEAARSLARQTGGAIYPFHDAICLASSHDLDKRLVTIEYLAPPKMFGDQKRTPRRHIQWAVSSGVEFGPTESAIYLPSLRKLIVRKFYVGQEEVRKRLTEGWAKYYASDEWPKEQQRQRRLRKLFPNWNGWN